MGRGAAGRAGLVGGQGVAAAGGRVDDAGHAGLAVARGGAVEPDGVGVFDCYLEDVWLEAGRGGCVSFIFILFLYFFPSGKMEMRGDVDVGEDNQEVQSFIDRSDDGGGVNRGALAGLEC